MRLTSNAYALLSFFTPPLPNLAPTLASTGTRPVRPPRLRIRTLPAHPARTHETQKT